MMVRVPVRDFVSGDKYYIVFAAPLTGGVLLTGITTTVHNENTFTSNTTIGSYPAMVSVGDGINYSILGNGLGSNSFTATASATVSVTINLGHTLVVLAQSVTSDLTNANLGSSANAAPEAEWSKYVDQTQLIAALDRWIDFIRVIPR